MSFFGKKTTPSEQLRQQNRDLRKAQRDIERDRRDLERQEKQLELEIKKAAKEGNKQVCTVLAKQLVQVRKQKARTYSASSKVQAVGAQSKVRVKLNSVFQNHMNRFLTRENMNLRY